MSVCLCVLGHRRFLSSIFWQSIYQQMQPTRTNTWRTAKVLRVKGYWEQNFENCQINFFPKKFLWVWCHYVWPTRGRTDCRKSSHIAKTWENECEHRSFWLQCLDRLVTHWTQPFPAVCPQVESAIRCFLVKLFIIEFWNFGIYFSLFSCKLISHSKIMYQPLIIIKTFAKNKKLF